ncbi:MAG: sialate O-acetylesterase [Cyclobacteriaceae bacterium]
MKKQFILTFALLLSFYSYSNIRLPKILGDNMVLQRNKPIKLWGWADAGEKVSVLFNNQSVSTKAGKNGTWLLTLKPETAGGPYQLILKGKNTITLSNILIGEVWVCSGQSNMEWPVRNSNNAEDEIKNGNYPMIRHFTVQKSVSTQLEADVKGDDWKVCTPENVGDFTAAGYFFARELYQHLNIPIGLIHTSWGGTHSETWTSRKAFEQSDEFKDMIASMPTVDLAELAKKKNEALIQRLGELGILIPSAEQVKNWNQLSFDHTSWPTMKLPGQWEGQALSDLDGLVWFRKTITITREDAGKEAMLSLAMIDDSDESFVNGTAVGSTKGRWNEKRLYKIPAGVLNEGKNVIAIRVEDTGGGGGVHGEANDLKLTIGKSEISLANEWSYQVESISVDGALINPNSYPTLLFNAMINPLLNYGIQGALWYQGESNAGRAYQYRKAFPLMIEDWRTHWQQGNFPFYFVQLASFNSANGTSENGSTWAELREAQTSTLSLPNTGMAVTTDIGEANDIHPRNKQDVGKRLAAIALRNTYNKTNEYSGPMFESMKVEGNKIRISFTHIDNGLMAKDKYGYLKAFEIAGSDEKFNYAKAWIEGNSVVVSADQVQNPVAVRFAWADNPEDVNLFNKEGFPAVPFRTDSWKGITEKEKFKF